MFQPPFCPYATCPNHNNPTPTHSASHGSYSPKCRPRPVPRFRCLSCSRTYSRQTFRMDYRDHKPHLNQGLLLLLTSGVGLRQASRVLRLSRRCLEIKARKLSTHLVNLNLNLRGPFSEGATLQFDEIETYETKRRERPVTFPILIESKSRFIVWGESGTLSPRGRMNKPRREAIRVDAKAFGPRLDQSKAAVRRTLAKAIPMVKGLSCVLVHTDQKGTYPGLLREAFGQARLQHHTTSSKRERTVQNPLFPINQMEAICRDLLGRLRRESWLVSKKRRHLDQAFQMLMAWKNYVRPRFNRDKETPAMIAGLINRRLKPGELVGWRQDFGQEKLRIAVKG
jgi:transposase-like protein